MGNLEDALRRNAKQARDAKELAETGTPPIAEGTHYKLGVTCRPGNRGSDTVFIKRITIPHGITPDRMGKERERIAAQVRIGRQLDHPHHVRLTDYESTGNVHSLIYTIAPGESLDKIARHRNFTRDEVLTITEQVAGALTYMHDTFTPPIIHGDMGPGNIMYDDIEQHVTVVDHGAAVDTILDDEYYTTRQITYGFTAPEVMRNDISSASDVYGLGMLVAYMVTKQHPGRFLDARNSLYRAKLKAAMQKGTTDDALVDLVEQLTNPEPSQRPTAKEVIGYVERIRAGESLRETPSSRGVGHSIHSVSFRPWMLVLGLSLGIPTIAVGYGKIKTSPVEDSFVETAPIEETVVEAAPMETPLEQFQQYEREQRDALYSQLLNEPSSAFLQVNGVENTLGWLVVNMPEKLGVLDKWTGSRKNVGPREYLFTTNPVSGGKADTFSLYSNLTLGREYSGGGTIRAPVFEYREALKAKARELGVKDDPAVRTFVKTFDRRLIPFYESIRDPTETDLKQLHAFVGSYVPDFMVDAFYEKSVAGEIATAREMIEAQPRLYQAEWTGSGIVDPTNIIGDGVQSVRTATGELGMLPISGGPWVLPEQYERNSSFSKWLYRRGPQFTTNFEIILDAYRSNDSADAFVDDVMSRVK